MESKRKPYNVPELIILGNIEQITLQGGSANKDVPSGVANSAFPNSPP